jgi:hypothetical protein
LTRFAPERFGIQFDPDTIHLLARVFHRALARYRKNMPVANAETGLRSELARYIVAAAKTGELRLAAKSYLEPAFD